MTISPVSERSQNTINGESGFPKNGLRIIIVGAGIGGLTAAIALRQQGHENLVGVLFLLRSTMLRRFVRFLNSLSSPASWELPFILLPIPMEF